MNIVFRVDASLQIGTGHVMRCLTLSQALRDQGAECNFICREHPGNLIDKIRQCGFMVGVLRYDKSLVFQEHTPSHASWLGADWQTDAEESRQVVGDVLIDWLIVDHYSLDSRWETSMRSHCRNIMVIDDLADRMHNCDLLLDQNLGRTVEDYSGLLNSKAKSLIGPMYALLRPEFSKWRSLSIARRENNLKIEHILVTMGGVDNDNATGEVLSALYDCELPGSLSVTVVMGPHAPWLTEVQDLAKKMPWKTQVLVGVDNMAQLMAKSDLAIGAAGSTSWERCCLGLPSIQIVLAQNQSGIAKALSDAGAAILLPKESIALNLKLIISSVSSAGNLLRISAASKIITQGLGAKYVSDYLKESNENHSLMQ